MRITCEVFTALTSTCYKNGMLPKLVETTIKDVLKTFNYLGVFMSLKHELKPLLRIVYQLNFKVEWLDDEGVYARCDYQNSVIYLNNVALQYEPIRKIVMVLAHEVGHLCSWMDHKNNKSLRRTDRERMAYDRGWQLLCNTGLAKLHSITHMEWRDLNTKDILNLAPDTKEAWT